MIQLKKKILSRWSDPATLELESPDHSGDSRKIADHGDCPLTAKLKINVEEHTTFGPKFNIQKLKNIQHFSQVEYKR